MSGLTFSGDILPRTLSFQSCAFIPGGHDAPSPKPFPVSPAWTCSRTKLFDRLQVYLLLFRAIIFNFDCTLVGVRNRDRFKDPNIPSHTLDSLNQKPQYWETSNHIFLPPPPDNSNVQLELRTRIFKALAYEAKSKTPKLDVSAHYSQF